MNIVTLLPHKEKVSKSEPALSATFLVAARRAGVAADTVEPALADLWEKATARWPEVAVAPSAFMGYLGERIPEDVDLLTALRAIHAADLYLACACFLGDPAALSAFEQAFIHRVPVYLARGNAPLDFIEEVQQRVRTRLFTTARGRPKIATYSGRGPLGAFVRITAVRTAADLDQDQAQQQSPLSYQFEARALQPSITDPELAALKRGHGAIVNRAIQAALAALPPRDATLLRLYFLEEVTYDSLARMYHVRRRQVRRWVDKIRAGIIEHTRRTLVEEFSLSHSEVDSLIRAVSGDLNTTILRFLKRPS